MLKNNSEGFTLLEILISILLLVVLVGVIGGAFRLAHRSVASGERRMDETERLRNSVALMDSQIQSSLPITEGEGLDKKLSFEGGEKTLKFCTTVSAWGDRRVPIVVSYALREDDQGKYSLIASEQAIGMQTIREVLLLDALDSLAFEYYSKAPTDEEGTWYDKWEDPNSTPEKIRIVLSRGKKTVSRVVAPRVVPMLSQGKIVFATTTIGCAQSK